MLRSRQVLFCLASVIFAAVCTFVLPFAFPVAPNVSVSYDAQFNNKVAVVGFIGSAILIALFNPWLRPQERSDKRLSYWYLTASAVAFILCLLLTLGPVKVPTGIELPYNFDRLQHLSRGQAPYAEFEYAYGPLLLYGPLCISRCLRVSLLSGYLLFFCLEWFFGVALNWYAIRHIEFPARFRGLLFTIFTLTQLPSILGEGLAYTPLRMSGAAGLVVFCYRAWRKHDGGFVFIVSCISTILFGFSISPELGFSLMAGLLSWQFLLLLKGKFSLAGLLITAGISIAATLYLFRLGAFDTLISFSSGGYSFPLVASEPIILALMVYLVAIVVFIRAVQNRLWEQQSVPMVLTCFAGLPAAFGRCDTGHIQFAASGFLLGLVAMQCFPKGLRWAWTALILLLIYPSYEVHRYMLRISRRSLVSLVFHSGHFGTGPSPEMQNTAGYSPSGSLDVHIENTVAGQPDTGFYFGTVNVISIAAIHSKINDIALHANQPLVLPPTIYSLKDVFATGAPSTQVVRDVEGSWYIPPMRRQPLTYEAIDAYILTHYRLVEAQPQYSLWREKK